ncbi:hypothetical protein QYF36_014796 [Acer negundo]|nr:hypothetical protein QYF36_014796 [Acer negundo]
MREKTATEVYAVYEMLGENSQQRSGRNGALEEKAKAGPQEVLKLVNSPDSSDDYMDKLFSIFKDELKKEERKEVHEEENVEENELISLSVDLVLKIAMLENERL